MANRGARVTSGTFREVDVPLACGHVLTFATTHKPAEGEELWCPRCERVQITAFDCYIVKCQKCSHTRNYGMAKLTAQTKATAHAMKGHAVRVMRRGKIVSQHGAGSRQLTIADLEPPPF